MQRRRCWQQCCIMQPCPDKPQSAEGRLCHFPECSDSMHCCWGATSWGALWVCLYTRVSMGWGLRGSGMLGWVGIQWCVWGCVRDNESHPTQFWKPSFMADLSHLVLCSEKKKKNLKKARYVTSKCDAQSLFLDTTEDRFLWRYIFVDLYPTHYVTSSKSCWNKLNGSWTVCNTLAVNPNTTRTNKHGSII